jgi:hypothetical protein
MKQLKKIQIEKMQIMHLIIEQMEIDFFESGNTSDFLKMLKSKIDTLIINDF